MTSVKHSLSNKLTLPLQLCPECEWTLHHSNLDRCGSTCGSCGLDLDLLRAIELLSLDYRVYCDLDGVLADFVSQWTKHYQYDPTQFRIKYGRREFSDQLDVASQHFWSSMDWTKEGPALWSFIRLCNPTILSAPANSTASRRGKIEWIKQHLSPEQPYIFRKAEQKQEFSTPTSILIDDYDKNVAQWQSRGGFAVLHQGDPIETIDKLVSLVTEDQASSR